MAEPTQAEVGNLVDSGMTASKIAAEYGCDLSNIARKVRIHKQNPPPQSEPMPSGWIDSTTQGYVVTSAQNNTSVHRKFLRSLEHYCKLHRYQLLVIPLRYRNPTSPKIVTGKPA